MTPRADFNLSRNRDDYIMDLLRYPDITTISTVYSLQPKFNSFKIFGVGLSRTGTHSLADYFHMCNLTVINSDFKDTQYLPNHSKNSKQFIYDDVHVVLGLPTALNYSEVLKVYPQAKFISTYRDPEKWYDSMQNYVDILKVELFGSIGIPLHLRYLFKSAYGTYLPDHDVWIRSYIAHYESVRRFIPAGQLLELQTDQLSEPISAKKLWAFLEIEPPGYITSIPHSNKLSTMRDSIARGIGSGKLTNIPKFPFTIYRRSATARSSYAYSSLISEPTNNDTFKWNFAMASIVLCKSIRDTYVGFDPKKKYDMVLLVIGSISKSIGDKLLSCYDRLFSVPYFANGPRSIVDNNYNAVIRSKFWTLGLTEYNRVQFIDSDHLVIRNLDHYFFRGYYDERRKHKTTFASRKCYKPKRIYCQYNLFAPASTGFMSIEPSKQALLDIKSIYDFGNWDFKEGWMGYGLFDFNVSEYSRSFVNTQEKTSWLQGTDPKFSFVPIFKNIPTTILQWKQSTWRFYCSWSDQGIAFYYFFVLKQIGGLIDHTDQSHEMIHFVRIC